MQFQLLDHRVNGKDINDKKSTYRVKNRIYWNQHNMLALESTFSPFFLGMLNKCHCWRNWRSPFMIVAFISFFFLSIFIYFFCRGLYKCELVFTGNCWEKIIQNIGIQSVRRRCIISIFFTRFSSSFYKIFQVRVRFF